MTKIIDLESGRLVQSKPVPIEFNKILMSSGALERCTTLPHNVDYIELICRGYGHDKDIGKYDLMFAYNKPEQRSNGILVIGKFNDGIV